MEDSGRGLIGLWVSRVGGGGVVGVGGVGAVGLVLAQLEPHLALVVGGCGRHGLKCFERLLGCLNSSRTSICARFLQLGSLQIYRAKYII